MHVRLKAIAASGIESVDVQALDEAAAVRDLERRGYTVLSVQANGWRAARTRPTGARFPLILFSEELRLLLQAGLPLAEAIETLAQKERTRESRLLLARLTALLREGRAFSAVLEQFPETFAPLYVATVRAAERTGDLGPALARYVSYAERVAALRKRALNACIYPALLVCVGGAVALFLLLFVVPRFGRIYAERGADLPLVSRLLLEWGHAVNAHGSVVALALAACAAAAIHTWRNPAARRSVADRLWRVPGLGEHMKTYQLARFYRTVGMLLRGGMPFPTALDMSGELLHPMVRLRLAGAARAIREGGAVADAMEAHGLTTPVALRLLGLAQKGGNMPEILEQIAAFHDEELARFVDRFTRLFEPILMALIGVVIGAIVVLMYMPIFELAGTVR